MISDEDRSALSALAKMLFFAVARSDFAQISWYSERIQAICGDDKKVTLKYKMDFDVE